MTAKHDKRVVSGRPGAGRFTADEKPEGLVVLAAPAVPMPILTLDFEECANDGSSPRRDQLGSGVIYGIRVAGSTEYRYIGQTVRGINRRTYLHRFESNKESPVLPVHKWLAKHRGENIEVDVLVEVERDDRVGLDEAEIGLIAALRGRGDDLMNVTAGGRGARGYAGTPESRRAHSERMTGEGNSRFGTTWSEETRAKILARQPSQVGALSPRFGATNSPEHRQRISDNHQDVRGELHPFFGKKHSDESRANMSAGWASRTPEERAETSARMRAVHANRSPEERALRGWRQSLTKHEARHVATGVVSKKCRICRGEPSPGAA